MSKPQGLAVHGGSWVNVTQASRVAFDLSFAPGCYSCYPGFRLLRRAS